MLGCFSVLILVVAVGIAGVLTGALEGTVQPNKSVAAIGSLAKAWEAMRRVMYRETSGKICLFNVHMISIQQNAGVRGAHFLNELHRLGRCVEKVRLIAIEYFHRQA